MVPKKPPMMIMTIYINYVFFDIQKMNENSLVKKKMSVI